MRDNFRLDVPVALVILAFFLITAFQTEQLVREHRNLISLQAAQQTNLAQAEKVRTQFQMLAGETAKLAEAGDAGAKAVLAQLKAQGVTVQPGNPAAHPEPAR